MLPDPSSQLQTTSASALLSLQNITKAFGGVKALDGVDMDLFPGEIHGLVGENGAGKSTLMKILSGVHTSYDGAVHLRGRQVQFSSTRSAMEHGIGMVYQELSNIGPLSVAENLFLASSPRTRLRFIDWKTIRKRSKSYLTELGLDIDIEATLESLPFGLQQLVEIARVVHSGAEALILDEPTSALSPVEKDRLFAIMRNLKARGNALVFISHFLDDVLAVCDRITVLKDGKKAACLDNKDLDKHTIIRHMLGNAAENIGARYEKAFFIRSPATAPIALEARHLSKGNLLRDVSFSVRAGEVVGLYGQVGAGHNLMGRCLFGLERWEGGEALFDGRSMNPQPPFRVKSRGIAYVDSDRGASLFLESEVYKNVTVVFLRYLLSFPLRNKTEISIAEPVMRKTGVKPFDPVIPLQNLSGGNQQKVALARWLTHSIRLLILDEPTRGMDVGAKEEVMTIVKELAKEGVAVLLISSEPEIIIANSNIIHVFAGGRIVDTLCNREVSKDTLLNY